MIDRLCRNSYHDTGAKKRGGPILEPNTGDWLGDGCLVVLLSAVPRTFPSMGANDWLLLDDKVPESQRVGRVLSRRLDGDGD